MSNERWTVCGDPHATNDNMDKIAMLFDIFEDIGNNVIILGDLFDTKELIHGKIFNYVRRRMEISALHFIVLVGNHDWFNLECKGHSLEAFKDLLNVHIVDEPKVIQGALFLPYYQNLKEFNQILKDSKYFECNVLFMHQGIKGFDYGNGRIADGKGSGEISSSVVKRFKRVISGHFHKHDPPFLGTPFSHDFGETDQVKYLAEYCFETDELTLVPTPFGRHRTLDFSTEEPDLIKKAYDARGADYLRVNLHGTELDINSFDKDQFPEVKFIDHPTDSDQVENESVRDTDSNEKKFISWAKDLKKLDEKLVTKGLAILEEVR